MKAVRAAGIKWELCQSEQSHLFLLQMGVYGYGGSNASSIWGVLYRSLMPESRKQKKKMEILNK